VQQSRLLKVHILVLNSGLAILRAGYSLPFIGICISFTLLVFSFISVVFLALPSPGMTFFPGQQTDINKIILSY